MASRTTLGLIEIVLLILYINEHTFVHSFIICKKLKQPWMVGLDCAQRYKIDIDWDAYATLILSHKDKIIATAMKIGIPC